MEDNPAHSEESSTLRVFFPNLPEDCHTLAQGALQGATRTPEHIKLLAQTGLSQLYRVWDPHLERHEAWKFLRDTEKTEVDRLLYEARLLARCDHPNIVKTHGIALNPDGRAAHAKYQFLTGPTLGKLITDRGRLSAPQTLAFGCRIAAALCHLHDQDILHLDLKPGNILLHHEVPFVIDLGLSHDLKRPEWNERIRGGTRGYWAPEQKGLLSKLTHRTDVFGLGAILFRCLTQSRPYDQDHQTREPWPQDLEIPDQLRDFIDRTLALPPEDRPKNMHACYQELRTMLEGVDRRAPVIVVNEQRGTELFRIQSGDRIPDGALIRIEATELPDLFLAVAWELADGSLLIQESTSGDSAIPEAQPHVLSAQLNRSKKEAEENFLVVASPHPLSPVTDQLAFFPRLEQPGSAPKGPTATAPTEDVRPTRELDRLESRLRSLARDIPQLAVERFHLIYMPAH